MLKFCLEKVGPMLSHIGFGAFRADLSSEVHKRWFIDFFDFIFLDQGLVWNLKQFVRSNVKLLIRA